MMSFDNIRIIEEFNYSIDFKKKIKEIELKKLNICVIINDKDIEFIFENYMDILEVKVFI